MKRFLVITTILALSLSFSLPALAATLEVNGADPTTPVSTGFTRDTGGGAAPIVKAKWEMNVNKEATTPYGYLGTDDSISAGAQFLPSGKYQVSKRIAVCAVVTDPDGVADITNGGAVYADTYYPLDIALGANHPVSVGCGQLTSEVSLTQLSKTDGYELFCNKVRNNNTNLPAFNQSLPYTYDEICAADGELMKETAYVFCGEKDLSYEDPAGTYKTLVLAQDKAGVDGTLVNNFEYLPLTAFETDFNSVSYGNVKLNTHKIVNGDLSFGTASLPTVRNIGNTRIAMKVWQNDMGLGKTNGLWNVKWDGRVGSGAAFTAYDPEIWTTLANELNLSETNEMDFSIDVFKFPPDHTSASYTGDMVLSATAVAQLLCQE
jgi:hypothetical protein